LAKRVTIIDIGSNSVRMVIYEKVSRFAFHLLHEAKSKVRIAEDAYKHNGTLQEAPMQRTFYTLNEFLQISNSFKVKKILCIATSALRDAPNKQTFLQKVKQKLNLDIKIISGEKEAYFGAIACANLLPPQFNALSVDIGGGSTELAYIDNNNVSHPISLEIGTVRLKELYFDTNDLQGAIKYIDKQLERLPITNVKTLIGIGGTFRAISNAIMKRDTYPLNKLHAYTYDMKTFKKFIEKLLSTTTNKELKKIFIDSNRYDVIRPGTLILQRLINKIDISKIVTSGVGVREGVFLTDLLRNSKHKFPHHYNTSVRYILDSFVQDKQYSNNLSLLSKKIFDLTYQYLNIDYKYRQSLSIASKLYPAGSSIHFYSQNKHTYYLIQSALEYGFTHEDIMLIATLTKYAKNKLPSNTHFQLYKKLLPDEQTTKHLSYLLSLSIILLSHRPRNLDFSLDFHESTLHVKSENELYLTKEAVAKLECEHQDFNVSF